MQKFLRRESVLELCGLPVSTLYDLMAKGEFPKPIKISSRTVAWLETDIKTWQEAKIAGRDGIVAERAA